jgi:hypothetical protein
MQFHLTNLMFMDLLLRTRCGVFHSSHLELTSDRIVVKGTDNLLKAAACTAEQFAAAERVREVIASSPRYRFDGERLQLISDKTTVTFVLISTSEMVADGEGGYVSKSRSG